MSRTSESGASSRMSFAMKSEISILLFFSFILGIYSAVYLEPQPLILGHEGQCYNPEDNTFSKPGEEMKMNGNECGRKICFGYFGAGIFAEVQTCGKVDVPPECQLKVNLSQPYPNCCGWITCPEPFEFESENEVDR